jgi:hypothetical protein
MSDKWPRLFHRINYYFCHLNDLGTCFYFDIQKTVWFYNVANFSMKSKLSSLNTTNLLVEGGEARLKTGLRGRTAAW